MPKILINVSDKDLANIDKIRFLLGGKEQRILQQDIIKAIKNGIILHDKHGDLKDQDVLLQELDKLWNERKGLSYVDIQDVIRLQVPAVIKGE